MFVPYFGLFASFVGCFSNSFLAFIFPTVFYFKIFHFGSKGRTMKPLMLLLCGIVCLVGISGMLVGSTITIMQIVQQFQQHSH